MYGANLQVLRIRRDMHTSSKVSQYEIFGTVGKIIFDKNRYSDKDKYC